MQQLNKSLINILLLYFINERLKRDSNKKQALI